MLQRTKVRHFELLRQLQPTPRRRRNAKRPWRDLVAEMVRSSLPRRSSTRTKIRYLLAVPATCPVIVEIRFAISRKMTENPSGVRTYNMISSNLCLKMIRRSLPIATSQAVLSRHLPTYILMPWLGVAKPARYCGTNS